MQCGIAFFVLIWRKTRSVQPKCKILISFPIEDRQLPRYALIDGYLRVAAARRLEKDTLLAHIFNGDKKQAQCYVLLKSGECKWDIFEQAGLIQELHRRHDLSQRQIAVLLGKDQSWVSRRLTILESLPEAVIKQMRAIVEEAEKEVAFK